MKNIKEILIELVESIGIVLVLFVGGTLIATLSFLLWLIWIFR